MGLLTGAAWAKVPAAWKPKARSARFKKRPILPDDRVQWRKMKGKGRERNRAGGSGVVVVVEKERTAYRAAVGGF